MSRPKHAVLLVKTPEGWLPTRIHSMPEAIVSAEFHATHLKFPDAIKVARQFNKKHIRPDRFDGRWALVIKSLRSNPTRDPALIAAKSKGGAT